jgi:hypothetical protein
MGPSLRILHGFLTPVIDPYLCCVMLFILPLSNHELLSKANHKEVICEYLLVIRPTPDAYTIIVEVLNYVTWLT